MSDNANKDKIAIIDGGIIFKWYFAIPNMKTIDGTPIGAVYGFTKMLVRLLEQKYKYILVAQDSGGQTFRHEMYPSYKHHRGSVPDDLKVQFPIMQTALEAINVPKLYLDGYEADDIIATYAKMATDYEVHIISGDKDMTQLVNDNIFIYDTSAQKRLGYEHVEERFGLAPEYIIDYLSLLGDAVDAVPGVRGIGKKTALDLIKNYGHIEDIYENIDSISSSKVKEALINGKEDAFLSKSLVMLHSIEDVPPLSSLQFKGFNYDKLLEFNQKYNFSFLTKLLHLNENLLI